MKKRYFVNEEKKVVVAQYVEAKNVFAEASNTLVRIAVDYSDLKNNPIADSDDIKSLRAVAKTTEPDVFNEAFGKDLAGVKLDRKYHKRMIADYIKVINELQKALDEAKSLRSYHNKKMMNIDNDLVRHFGYDPDMLINE